MVASRGDVRRGKLYYLRGRVGRRARVRERQYTGVEEEILAAPEEGMADAQGTQEEAEAADVSPPEDAAEGEAPEGGAGETSGDQDPAEGEPAPEAAEAAPEGDEATS